MTFLFHLLLGYLSLCHNLIFVRSKKIFHCVDIPHFVYLDGHLAIINGSIVSMSLQMTTIVWGFSLLYCITISIG